MVRFTAFQSALLLDLLSYPSSAMIIFFDVTASIRAGPKKQVFSSEDDGTQDDALP